MENKKEYIAPCVELIELDNEISLALQSETPPLGPGEVASLDSHVQNPFQDPIV
jgi:hypothetical protein